MGTAFQVTPGVLVTAWHVLRDVGAPDVGDAVVVCQFGSDADLGGTVGQIDQVVDLGVVQVREPLDASVGGLVASSLVPNGAMVEIQGASHIDDFDHDRPDVQMTGVWQGPSSEDEIVVARLTTEAVVPGMSGAPVRLLGSDQVVGVVKARYETDSTVLERTVWAAVCEHVGPLVDVFGVKVGALPAGWHPTLTAQIEGPLPSSSQKILGPFVGHDRFKALAGRRRGGLVDASFPYVAPPVLHEAHPDRIWQTLSSEPGRAVLIRGPGGVGKTRTCLEVANRAQQDRWRVIHALTGEPAATTDGLVDVVFSSEEPVLVVLDYVNELHGLDLSSIHNRLLPAAIEAGVQIAIIGSARNGWLATDPPLGPFDLVAACDTPGFQHKVSHSIVTHTAPRAVSEVGLAEVERLCGRHPMIALLVARELERLAIDRRATEPWVSAMAAGDLVGWLRRRFSEDGFTVARPKSAVDLAEVSEALVVAATIAGTLPARADDVMLAAEGAAVAMAQPRSRGRRILRVLDQLGWLTAVGSELGPVHDVVIDYLLTEVLATDLQNESVTNGYVVLDGGLNRPRALGRLASNLGRIVSDLHLRNDSIGEDLGAYCRNWFDQKLDEVQASLLACTDPDEASYALGSLLNGPPWLSGVLTHWPTVVQPWLEENRSSVDARHLLYVGLRNVPEGHSNPLPSVALAWLDHHGERRDASFVLGPLLGRDDLAEPKRVETAALAWLEHHSELPNAQFVLGPLLGRDDLAEPKRVETAALAWLEHHSELPDAQFVLGPLLGRDDLAESKRVETAALAWLEHHGELPDASFVLRPLLGRDDLAEPKRVETAALAWLEHHGERLDAQFVLRPLLGRDDLAEPKRVESAALAWLEHHGERPEAASFVLRPLWAVTTWPNRSVSRLPHSHGWNTTANDSTPSLSSVLFGP
ncbi:MAG: trypsin-like peptidase domain-containing protein [Candidatus Microthrix sp.]|nr:trypsin-like peptidase domain-containing protein [Candidatus Microthrix sp.]